MADIRRAGVQPRDERLGHRPQVPGVTREHRATQRQAHLRVVGHLPGLQAQPAATDHLSVHPIGRGNFAGGHEFDGRAQRIAHREAEIGAERSIE